MAFGLGDLLENDEFDFGSMVELISHGPGGMLGDSLRDLNFEFGSRITFAFDVAGAIGLANPVFGFDDMSAALADFADANGLILGESLPGTDTFDARIDLGPDPAVDGYVDFYYNGPGDYGIQPVIPLPDVPWGEEYIWT